MEMKGYLEVKTPAECIAAVDSCKLSIASNASYISLYCFAADAKCYVAERYVDRLPKASIGKTCVRFRKLADLDEKALVALIETARMGLVA